MFKWTAFPYIRFSAFLIIGVLVEDRYPRIWLGQQWLLCLLISGFLLCHLLSWRLGFYKMSLLNAVAGGLLIGALGGWISMLNDHRHNADHYLKFNDIEAFHGVVVGSIVEKERYVKVELRMVELLTSGTAHHTSGKALIHLKRPVGPIVHGDALIAKGRLQPIPTPTNPGTFDYRKYLLRQNIFSQSFLQPDEYMLVKDNGGFSIYALSMRLREWVRGQVAQYIAAPKEQQIAMALIVGIKDYIDSEVKRAYAAAGATHVLAVSGLHVGILYLFMSLLLKRYGKRSIWRFLIPAINLCTIWLYAMITGLSASVFRAAIMFSVMILAETFGKQKNVYNSLGIAALVLVMIDPNNVFQVGFQLSFVAVLGIAYIHPRIYLGLNFGHPLSDKIWSMTCVSIAAQISTAPLTIFYFHQFPTYALLSNLVVIPAASGILLLGIPMVVLGFWISWLAKIAGFLIGAIIRLLNYLMIQVEHLPWSTLEWLYFNRSEVLLMYGALMLFLISRNNRSFSALAGSVILSALLLFSIHWRQYQALGRREIVIYDVGGESVVDIIHNGQAQLVVGEEVDWRKLEFEVNPNRLSTGYLPADVNWSVQESFFTCETFYCMSSWCNLRILKLVDGFAEYEFTAPIQTDILLVSNNAVSDVSELVCFDYHYLIFDSSNTYQYLKSISHSLRQASVVAHIVPFDGHWSLILD